MPIWNISDNSNAMDLTLAYDGVLQEMRNFVTPVNAPTGQINIDIIQVSKNPPLTTRLQMRNTNFQVTAINIPLNNYNYTNPAPDLSSDDIPNSFPVGNKAASDNQKTKLLYMFPEAARSSVIQKAIKTVLVGHKGKPATLHLRQLSPLVNAYGHTAALANVNINHPARPLTGTDYMNYAQTLAVGTPDRQLIIDAVNAFS